MSFIEHVIPSSIGCFRVPMLKSRGWSNGGEELEIFDDKAETPQGDTAEEHDMKEPRFKRQIMLMDLFYICMSIH